VPASMCLQQSEEATCSSVSAAELARLWKLLQQPAM